MRDEVREIGQRDTGARSSGLVGQSEDFVFHSEIRRL